MEEAWKIVRATPRRVKPFETGYSLTGHGSAVMPRVRTRVFLRAAAAALALNAGAARAAETPPPGAEAVPRFDLPASGLQLARHTEVGAFFDVVGRRSAVFGYENRGFEAWVYPLKLIDDFKLSFQLQGYPLEIPGEEIQTGITVRPESTVFTYSHAGFQVRQINLLAVVGVRSFLLLRQQIIGGHCPAFGDQAAQGAR